MQKAMFFEEAYHKGVLNKVTQGFILSMRAPDVDDINRKHDPFLVEVISYSGVKSVNPVGSGVKFQAQGQKMFLMLEPSSYTENHIEPTYRSNNTTAYMPYRFKDCETFLTRDSRFKVMIPQTPYNCYDSFTVSFPGKGDIAVLYFIFNKDINVVNDFIQNNFQEIVNKMTGIQSADASKIAKNFMAVVKKHSVIKIHD